MLHKLYNHLFCRPHMGRRIPVLFLSVILMGMCVAVFEKLQVGTDPYNVFHLAFTYNVLHWDSLGNWQLIFNLIVLAIILLLKEQRYVGIGTLANMVLVGYSRDFFKPIIDALLPGDSLSLQVRGGLFIPTLLLFLCTVAFYLVVDLGSSPYDALPQIIASRLPKLPAAVIRIAYDIFFTIVGLLLGGRMGVFTVAACFFIGPAISAIAVRFKPWFE